MSDMLASAQAAFDQRNFDEAMRLSQASVDQQVTNGQAWRLLTFCSVAKGEFAQGIEAGRKAAAFIGNDPELRYALAYSLYRESQFERAIEECDAALALSPRHDASRQLLCASLLEVGKKLKDEDPLKAEGALDRLAKMQPENPECISLLLDLFHQTNQKGKALKLLKDLPPAVLTAPAVADRVAELKKDPEYEKVMSHAAMAQRVSGQAPSAAAPRPQVQPPQQIRYVPCPNCRQQITDYASLCPHCNFRIRATGTFAGRDTGSNYTWQEIALTVMAVVYLLFTLLDIALSFLVFKNVGVAVAFNLLGLICSLGIIFRNDFLMTIAKWVFILNLLGGVLGAYMMLAIGKPIEALGPLLQILIAGFMVYLLNQEVD